jgi:hypothetical protein
MRPRLPRSIATVIVSTFTFLVLLAGCGDPAQSDACLRGTDAVDKLQAIAAGPADLGTESDAQVAAAVTALDAAVNAKGGADLSQTATRVRQSLLNLVDFVRENSGSSSNVQARAQEVGNEYLSAARLFLDQVKVACGN